MVVTAHPRASEFGLEILKSGGNEPAGFEAVYQ